MEHKEGHACMCGGKCEHCTCEHNKRKSEAVAKNDTVEVARPQFMNRFMQVR